MNNEFQTTFIPKKPVGESVQPKQPTRRNPSVGIFTMVATLLFILSIVAGAGIYFYSKLLATNIDAMKETLVAAEDRIEQGFIVELQDLDKRLRNANQLLSQHIALSPFFRLLEEDTLKSIQYDSFAFSFQEGRPVATITGQAREYRTIAEQSINFGENPLIQTHVFSNFALTQDSNVSFNLKVVPDDDLYFFERSIGRIANTTFTNTPVINVSGVQAIEDTGSSQGEINNQNNLENIPEEENEDDFGIFGGEEQVSLLGSIDIG